MWLTRHRWQLLKTQVLKRRVPHTVISWRYLLPRQSRAIRLHRYVFLHAWPTLPRPIYALFVIYSLVLWYSYHAWVMIYRSWKQSSQYIFNQYQLTPSQQLLDLIELALLHGIPPQYYRIYRLYERPRSQWLDFIYAHELPHWHHVLSKPISAASRHYLTSKDAFTNLMHGHDIASIPTLHLFESGDPIQKEKLFRSQNYFLKPDNGYQADGCYILDYNAENDAYKLQGTQDFAGQIDILNHLQTQINGRDYLLQPLQKNHPQLAENCHTDRLTTLRLITLMHENEVECLYAQLEVPQADANQKIWAVRIDCQTGITLNYRHPHPTHDDARKETTQDIIDKPVPDWEKAVALCIEAHRLFPDVLSIGWDVALTPNGPILIEGNINWGVTSHQTDLDQPPLVGQYGEYAYRRIFRLQT